MVNGKKYFKFIVFENVVSNCLFFVLRSHQWSLGLSSHRGDSVRLIIIIIIIIITIIVLLLLLLLLLLKG